MALALLEKDITKAVEKLSPSVVSIRSRRYTDGFPFGRIPADGAGSGIIIDADGLIVTNYHVIADTDEIRVHFNDGAAVDGTFLGGDKLTDIALVKVDRNGLPAASLGDSEKLRVGQFAIAIGNALGLPSGPTASIGAVSALSRPLPGADFIFEGLIQTDAAINPGNSGGPLADLQGRVIGINTAMIPFAQGLGFAIPINTVKWVIQQLADEGRVMRPWLGVSVVGLNETLSRRLGLRTTQGVMIAQIMHDGPADRAGLDAGDVILEIDGQTIEKSQDLLSVLSRLPMNSTTEIRYERNGKRRTTTLAIRETPVQRRL